MSENTTAALQSTLAEDVEVEESTLTLEEIVTEITDTVFGSDTTISPYKIAKVINTVFTATMTEKQIPAQMMYHYANKGMIVSKAPKKQYTKDEVTAFVNKYTAKHVNI